MVEIDVVVDSKSQQNGHSPNSKPGPGASISELVVDVCSASAYGDLEKLQGFVERDGQSVSLPDGNGYYALQWAALNNVPNIALYIIEVIVSVTNLCLLPSFRFGLRNPSWLLWFEAWWRRKCHWQQEADCFALGRSTWVYSSGRCVVAEWSSGWGCWH